jgi:hypothetical protein
MLALDTLRTTKKDRLMKTITIICTLLTSFNLFAGTVGNNVPSVESSQVVTRVNIIPQVGTDDMYQVSTSNEMGEDFDIMVKGLAAAISLKNTLLNSDAHTVVRDQKIHVIIERSQ